MKKINFEKVSKSLTKEEMSTLKGGLPKNGDTITGDTYYSSCACWNMRDTIINGVDQTPK